MNELRQARADEAEGIAAFQRVAYQRNRTVLGVEPIPGGHFAAGFGHLMGGYDVGYYGYLWSLVYATDMFSAFKATDPLDPVTGARYREAVLDSVLPPRRLDSLI